MRNGFESQKRGDRGRKACEFEVHRGPPLRRVFLALRVSRLIPGLHPGRGGAGGHERDWSDES